MDLKKLIDAINEKSIDKVKAILSVSPNIVNDVDESGMTSVQHACFKGSLNIVDFLVSLGADINTDNHKMGYTALMFAALSGSEEIVVRLLGLGAKTDRVNSVGRTASQMASFVGNHRIATIINNYIEKGDIQTFTIPNGIRQEVRLIPFLVDPVHNLVNDTNFSPIKICLSLVKSGLINHWKSLVNVFDALCRRNFDPHNTNEGLSIKFHLMATVCRRAGESYDNGDLDLSGFLKKLLIGIEPFGLPEGQEKLIRQSLKEFPFIESQLYRIIISELCKITIGHHPTALELLNNRINGQIFFKNNSNTNNCSTCYSDNSVNKKCSACSCVAYCNADCQKLHWFTHKKFCKTLKGLLNEATDSNATVADSEEQGNPDTTTDDSSHCANDFSDKGDC